MTQTHSIRNDASHLTSNPVTSDQNGTLAQATLNAQHHARQTEGDAPVYKNRAPKFVPAEKLRVRLGPSKVDGSL